MEEIQYTIIQGLSFISNTIVAVSYKIVKSQIRTLLKLPNQFDGLVEKSVVVLSCLVCGTRKNRLKRPYLTIYKS